MDTIKKILFSVATGVILMVILSIASAAATFIENDYGAETARAVVYHAWWFRLVFILIGLNLIGILIRWKMWTKGKRFVGLIHAAFVIILLGAAFTSIGSMSGFMHIREGETSNAIASERMVLTVRGKVGAEEAVQQKQLLLSRMSRNRASVQVRVGKEDIRVRVVDYVSPAQKEIVEDPSGIPMIALLVSEGGPPRTLIIQNGETVPVSGVLFTFNSDVKADSVPVVQIRMDGEALLLRSSVRFSRISMAEEKQERLAAHREHKFETRTFYAMGQNQFALKAAYALARIHAVEKTSTPQGHPGEKPEDALIVEIVSGSEVRYADLFGQSGVIGESQSFQMGKSTVEVAFGSKKIELPFNLELVDFELERYPGSRKPSSFASEVIIQDPDKEVTRPFRIYMNHILKYRGFRFFQHSFDNDELGTILLVAKDPGTPLTYLGYFLLTVGLIGNFFNPASRLRKLGKKMTGVAAAFFIFLAGTGVLPADASAQVPRRQAPVITHDFKVPDYDHSRKFGALQVQDSQGRIKPINSLAYEIIRKIAGKEGLPGIHPDQAALGLFAVPELWQRVPILRVDHIMVKRLVGIESVRSYASFLELVDPVTRQFVLAGYVRQAHEKSPNRRDAFDKDVLRIDGRFRTAQNVLGGSVFRIFPLPGDPGNTWSDLKTVIQNLPEDVQNRIVEIAKQYIMAVNDAESDSWNAADDALFQLKKYQSENGKAVALSSQLARAEVFHNEAKLFIRAAPLYFWAGLLLLLLCFIALFHPFRRLDIVMKFFWVLLGLAFLLHTAGFAVRWIAANHAPWSNKYESMVYIAWATVLAGFIFSKKNRIPLAISSIFTGLILFMAHSESWDPSITNLVPVLKSKWLIFHVSVITSSYGFLCLGALMGLVTVLLFIFRTKKTEPVIDPTIEQLCRINELSLIVGLSLLTIGNFLGAVWANESWGKYWGWDPKESWTLVTMLIYVIVIHMRLLPKFWSLYGFSVASVFSLGTVFMTYFGVNYYLSGLHSYAQGDPVPVPVYVYITVIVFVGLALLGSRNSLMKVQKVGRES